MSYGSGAGAGAEEMARRAAAREAELEAQLARARQTRQSWEAGAAGERAVAAVLEQLSTAGWRVLHDVHWPGRPQANLDHVAVGPGGVVVVDAKNWSGTVTVSDGMLRQNGYRRQQTLEAAGAAAAAVTAMLAPGHRSRVHVAVCLVQQELDAQRLPPGVVVVGLSELAPWLTQLPPALSPEAVDAVHAYLNRELTGTRSPQLASTADLRRVKAPPPQEAPSPLRRRQRGTPTPARTRSSSSGSRRRSIGVASQSGGITEGLFKLGAVVLLLVGLNHWISSLAAGQPDPATPPTGVSSTPPSPATGQP
jgi:hypothetical protein